MQSATSNVGSYARARVSFKARSLPHPEEGFVQPRAAKAVQAGFDAPL
jgi:hypothetical protein